MELKLAEILAEHNFDIQVREDYSGRGMYGKTTTGVVCDDSEIFEAIASIMTECNEDEREYVANQIRYGFRTDSMGYNTIYY